MPTPREGESRSDFISRCVSVVTDEGLTQDQALGRCYGLWEGKKEMELLESLKSLIARHEEPDEHWEYQMKGKRAGSPKASDYLVVENADEPSTWHLPVKENGKPNHRLMGAAWAALHGGYRGNKYSGPGKSAAIKKLRALYRSEGISPPGEKSRFTVWKQKDGTYRWFAIFSNPYRDRDNPPEILTEAAQIDFVKAVNDGSWPHPELWLWHIPGTRCGQSDLIAYDTDNRLTLASGTFDVGKEVVAEALNSTPVSLKTSHGMPRSEIQRDPDDQTIITRFRSKEISPLPADYAANELTGFQVLGGDMKLIPDSVKEKLPRLFPDEEQLKLVSDAIDATGTEAKEANLEFKDKEDKDEEVATEEVKEVETVEPEEETKEEVEAPEETLDRKEVEEAIGLLAQTLSVVAAAVEAQNKSLEVLTGEVIALKKSSEEKIAELVKETPRLSLRDLVLGEIDSVIGKEETRVDGRTKLGSDGPEETKEDDTLVSTGHPAMDRSVTDIIRGAGVVRQGGSNE